ncbi:MAG: peptidoglycan DD-metalloendopeptidase family protein [Bacteroidales bacterium]|nr:peptidoglycan DD-metalloendopeptidase family protein [Bacteroidales bacterium]
MYKRPFIILAVTAMLLPSCGLFHKKQKESEAEPVVRKDTVYPLGFCTDSLYKVEGTLKNGEIFTTLLGRLGMDKASAYTLATSCDSVFDVRKMRAGNSWQAYYEGDSLSGRTLRYLVYEQSRVDRTVFGCTPPYTVRTISKPVETVREYADVTINSSLWNDMLAAGVSPLMIVELADIYAWTVDFFGLRKGDRFRVVYDRKLCEGEVIGIESVPYAKFSRDGKDLPAIMLDQGDGGNRYWNEKGESMKKAFLKAPLKFTRISSGFSYHRKHPVHGTVRAHTGVDYAAPTGTPVMAIGDGSVISKGWGGGGGNTVKIRHNSVYTTAYLHLSKYAAGLKVGDRVRQGQVIGYVGMTGTATGPHLDFRVWKNGTPINPLTMESPSAEPIRKEFLPQLDSLNNAYSALLDSLGAKKTAVKSEGNLETEGN